MAALRVYAWIMLVIGGAAGQDLALQPFSYSEDFEGEMPQVDLWAQSGEATVNFLGASAEQAFEGTQSLKLDATLDSGAYHYWGVRLRVPCAGKLKLTARVLVAEGTNARVGFGTNMVYPPTHHSGCGPTHTFEKPTDGWQLVECDLVERGESGAARVVEAHTWTASGEDVGAYLDRWALFVYGGDGKRVVVYVDDVRVEGEAPTEDDYEADIAARWAEGQRRLGARVAEWRAAMVEAEASLEVLTDLPEAVRDTAEGVRAGAGRAADLISDLLERGYGSPAEVQAIEEAVFALRHGPETIAAIATAVAEEQPYLVYAPPAMTNDRMVADTFPIPARVAGELSCSGCPGEYESVSLAVYSLSDVTDLLVTPADLNGPGGTIPASAVDSYAVKCWYQAGKEIGDRTHKMLVPELLLKDDDLLLVDTDTGENFLRSTAEDGTETYLLCSGPSSEELEGVRPIDAEELLPVDIPERTLKQFWLRVRIPEDAAPGVYQGAVRLVTRAGSRELPLRVTVHPFELQPSRLIYSIYYRAKLSPDGQPTIGSERKSETQYRAEIEDMRDHGVTYPTNYQGWDEELLRRVLEIRQEAGLPGGPFFTLGQNTGASDDADVLDALRRTVAQWIEFCEPFGYDEIYFYGIDEARGDRLEAQRATWRAVQDAGGKTFVACYEKTFEAMGDRLNCAVLARRPDPEEAEKWHSVGSLAFTYAFPQVGNEEPETYRRNFGLVLWKAGFDGAMDYAYQHGFNHVWNDFDSDRYRDHNFTYPTVDGVVGTIQWEGFREAVDDVRYVTTLESAIDNAPEAMADTARSAQEWLDALDPDTADLDATRAEMVRWITELLGSAQP